jgi:hypothetical protein
MQGHGSPCPYAIKTHFNLNFGNKSSAIFYQRTASIYMNPKKRFTSRKI